MAGGPRVVMQLPDSPGESQGFLIAEGAACLSVTRLFYYYFSVKVEHPTMPVRGGAITK